MVIHILRDGTQVKDIRGHIVRIADAEIVYKLMDTINRRTSANNEIKKD